MLECGPALDCKLLVLSSRDEKGKGSYGALLFFYFFQKKVFYVDLFFFFFFVFIEFTYRFCFMFWFPLAKRHVRCLTSPTCNQVCTPCAGR